jgi:hypothetical protein
MRLPRVGVPLVRLRQPVQPAAIDPGAPYDCRSWVSTESRGTRGKDNHLPTTTRTCIPMHDQMRATSENTVIKVVRVTPYKREVKSNPPSSQALFSCEIPHLRHPGESPRLEGEPTTDETAWRAQAGRMPSESHARRRESPRGIRASSFSPTPAVMVDQGRLRAGRALSNGTPKAAFPGEGRLRRVRGS